MSAYEPEKDTILASRRIGSGEGPWVEAVLASYDGGARRIGLNRFITRRNGTKQVVKLGRLSLDEAREVVSAITELLAEAGAGATE